MSNEGGNEMNRLSKEEVLRELRKNHNHSWFEEIYQRNINFNGVALTYRGKKIYYHEMFRQMLLFARALRSHGAKKGMEIPICMPNVPEFVYLLGAISIVGAKANVFGDGFDDKYIEDIISDCDSPFMFVSNMNFNNLIKPLKTTDKSIIISPFENSLDLNPYKDITELYYKLDEEKLKDNINQVNENNKVIDLNDFLKSEKNILNDEITQSTLDDEFMITYSSGSTNSLRPKAIIHANRSYITMGRYHDQEVSGIPSMKDKITLAHIPTHSNTNFMSSISDTLMQGGTVALEPIYDKDYFLCSLNINKPALAIATRSFWLNAMKLSSQKSYKNVRLDYLLVPTEVGEPLAVNEEKALNQWLKKMRTGTKFIPSPSSFITMSVAGGDCEHGGIFLVLFRVLRNKLSKEKDGMNTYSMVDVAVLDKQGNVCPPGKEGILTATSPCDMVGYKNAPEETAKFFITDNTGKVRGNCNVYGYIDSNNRIYMKGRVPDKEELIPCYRIADAILKDTKKILSCEVITVEEENQTCYIAHIEPQVNTSVNIEKILQSAYQRCQKAFGSEFCSSLYFRFRSNEESFPLTGCGKRNIQKLKEEGIDNTIKPTVSNYNSDIKRKILK